MNEFIQTEIRFSTAADVITPDELALLESILPEIILGMMQAEELHADD